MGPYEAKNEAKKFSQPESLGFWWMKEDANVPPPPCVVAPTIAVEVVTLPSSAWLMVETIIPGMSLRKTPDQEEIEVAYSLSCSSPGWGGWR
ncbi:MAG: hypothetical protein HC936_13520 [Leptolyngbyaceae cyanobacterium SU_3_3]|nr:hypothetical protein [Leptolyngbyaceae cyanobacterium SU_3_3]